jgi:membrane protease subunit (stomatin/prohibitin family)
MLFKEITALYYEDVSKPINVFCGQNAELFIVEAGGTYSYHISFIGLIKYGVI